jgi:dGTPase
LLSEKLLNRDVRIWRQAARTVEKEYGKLPDECRRYFIIRCIIDMQVRDVVETTEARILQAGVTSADDVRLQAKPLVQYSPVRRELNLELRDYLYKNLYYNPVVHGPNLRAVKMLDDLFAFYLKHPKEIGEQARRRARKIGRHRAICDYLAGMTDRYAMQEHARLFGPTP